MKIVVTGLRGIPGIQGGVETHCEELYPRIVDETHKIVVIRRPEYVSAGNETTNYKGVDVVNLKTLPGKHLEAFTHTFLAVFYAKRVGADVVHIHAIGPSLMTPLVRLLGMKAVVTHHGPDYDRQKWGKLSKSILRLGERLGTRYANRVIVISEHIQHLLHQKHPAQKQVSLIHNGVKLSCVTPNLDYIHSLGLQPNGYVLAVGRFVEEKGFDLLIKAFAELGRSDLKLVIAGDADHEDSYSRKLKEMAKKYKIVLTGFIQKEQLAQLYHYTTLFVLPSFHEGLPISLLEAMNCDCNVLVSDIPANTEVGLPREDYFLCGNQESLVQQLKNKLSGDAHRCQYDMRKYDWDYIAQQTSAVYDSLITE